MARVNIDVLGIRELKWNRMGEFNSDDHYIYYCAQESLRRNGVALMVNKSPKCSTWMQSQRQQNDLCSSPGKLYHITVIQVCAWPVTLKKLTLNGSMRPTRPARTNTQKRCPFHYRGLECKSRKDRKSTRLNSSHQLISYAVFCLKKKKKE